METITVNETPIHEFKYVQVSNYGFCYALLSPENQYMHTPFMCKDYLQDIVWSETTGMSSDLWGIKWNKGMFDITQKRFRIALIGGSVSMKSRAKNLQVLLNHFDDAQGIDRSEVFYTQDNSIIVVDFDSAGWTFCGPMLSALTTIIRVSPQYKASMSPKEYLEDVYNRRNTDLTPKFMQVEAQRLESTLPKLLALLDSKKIPMDWSVSTNVRHAHNNGIMMCDFEKSG